MREFRAGALNSLGVEQSSRTPPSRGLTAEEIFLAL
jgi:hypothetical protein